jgi:hypothetical protein
MERVSCDFCGLPFSVRSAPAGATHYCCSGCALASRIPVHDGTLPVSKQLVAALALGFGVFNQMMFAVLGAAVAGERRVEMGGKLMIVSLLIGLVVLLVNVTLLTTTRPRRISDIVGGSLGVLAAVLAVWSILKSDGVNATWFLLGANLWFACWMSRGWVRRSLRRKQSHASQSER